MKKYILSLMALVATMSIQAQVVKVYKNGTLQETYTNTATDKYKVVFEEATAPASQKLNITVTSSDIATLKAIKVVTDQNIAGESKEKVLQVAEAQQTPAAEGTVYSVEIPSQEYAFYQIYLSEDGTTYKEAMATKSNVGAITEDKAIDYEKNAVQLWADGPYFATENAGSMSWSAGMNAWGSAWTLPSESALTTLIADYKATPFYTQEGSTWGFKFTGKAKGYTGNSIFLPSNGGDENFGCAYYWSSTVSGTEKARCVRLDYYEGFIDYWQPGTCWVSRCVRLVLR